MNMPARLNRLLKTAQADAKARAVDNANRGAALVRPFIAGYEQFRPSAYWDAAGRRWTMGYGQTTVKDPTTGADRPVRRGDAITEQDARSFMARRVADNASRIYSALPWSRNLTPEQLAPLYDVAYNGGVDLLVKKSPGLNRDMSAPGANYDEVLRRHIPTYRKAKGKVVPGLESRRGAAVDRFLGKKASAEKRAASPVSELIGSLLRSNRFGRYLSLPNMVANPAARSMAAAAFGKTDKGLLPSDYAAWVSMSIRNSERGKALMSHVQNAAGSYSARILGEDSVIRLLNQPGEMAERLLRLRRPLYPGVLSMEPEALRAAGILQLSALPLDKISPEALQVWRDRGIFPLSSLYGLKRVNLPGAARKAPGIYIPFRLSTHHNGNRTVRRLAGSPDMWEYARGKELPRSAGEAVRPVGALGQHSYIDMHFPVEEPGGTLPIRFRWQDEVNSRRNYFGGMKLSPDSILGG